MRNEVQSSQQSQSKTTKNLIEQIEPQEQTNTNADKRIGQPKNAIPNENAPNIKTKENIRAPNTPTKAGPDERSRTRNETTTSKASKKPRADYTTHAKPPPRKPKNKSGDAEDHKAPTNQTRNNQTHTNSRAKTAIKT